MAKKKKPNKAALYVVFGAAFFIAWVAVGLMLGGATFFKLAAIDYEHLQLDSLIYYWQHYGDRKDVQLALVPGTIVCVLFVAVPFVITVIALIPAKEEIHGSARFANDQDLAKSGLFNEESTKPELLLGKMDKGKFAGKYVKTEGQTFVGVSAPTGSGKGVGFVLPNLVNYSDSVVCMDIKLENFVKSAGFRAKCGQSVYLFSPDGYAVTKRDLENGQLRSHRWNPYYYVRRKEAFRIGDVQVMANSIYPLTGDGKADMWNQLAQQLFNGLSLWMLDTEKVTGVAPTFPYLLSLRSVEGGFYTWLRSEVKKEYLSDECKKALNAFLTFPNETQGSILATFDAQLAIFNDKTVAAAVSDNDFDFRDMRRKGISIYVGVQPPNKGRFGRLLNLFFEQLISENTRVLPEFDDTLTHQLLALLDELPALGRINQIKESIGFTRQYNVRYALIYQDKSQLEDNSLYGQQGAENILSNLLCEIIYPPSKVTPRVEQISRSLGTKTVEVKTESVNRGAGKTSRTTNATPQRRELMKPHEIVELGYETHPDNPDLGLKVLMFKQNQRAFIMNKLISFDDPMIAERIAYSESNVPQVPLLNIQ
ncbi:type IV secretory system conjugative DNA transfer family protein [Vibrio tubiashii]|uniref:Conjugal transfer protein TraK n=1 Tax=Vibrio tubiashii ATCC 19109 TaxID=1051646 RepID=F9T6U2_9VIBR|nr:type IV secretory system conjugative DNA transfer family protein [Vibrio tubiashii]AIW17505.1 conjugal transfer protein TraK [Vibrio tubiashii ATCC 19109]EGU54497.1 conjugal transfer protein TraK [Vibrio tubiashii ATCC 19109]EIF01276.1 conjugal transfer protein TraK [Vibrio tubiashii NCIMB 1337 = ATCC 19106]